MPNYGVPGTIGLAPDAPCLPGEWREASGVAFACLEAAEGRPSDALLAALTRHHPRLHDGRTVDAVEAARIDRVLTKPGARLPQMPMVEAGEMGGLLARTRETPAERRARIAALVPAGKVTGWVPQWRRAEPGAASGQQAVGSGCAEPAAAAVSPPAPQVVGRPSTTDSAPAAAPSRVPDFAPAPARMAGAPAVARPSAGAPVVVAAAAPVRQSPPAASPGGMGGSALWQRPAAAPASTPPCSPAAAVPSAGCASDAASAPAKPPRAKRVPSIKHIIAVAERHAGLAPGGLGLGRAPAVTAARQVAMWLAFTLLQWDLARIGATFGRDRTTVRYAVQTVTERRDRDDAFADALDTLVAEAKVEPTARRRKTAP